MRYNSFRLWQYCSCGVGLVGPALLNPVLRLEKKPWTCNIYCTVYRRSIPKISMVKNLLFLSFHGLSIILLGSQGGRKQSFKNVLSSHVYFIKLNYFQQKHFVNTVRIKKKSAHLNPTSLNLKSKKLFMNINW